MNKINLILLLSGLCSLSTCSNGYLLLFNKTKSWSSAQSYCREKCVDLATINDMEEMKDFQEDIGGRYSDGAWIGLRKGTTRRWHWSLTQKGFYKDGEKDNLDLVVENDFTCGAYQDGKLYTASCKNKNRALCFDGTENSHDQYILKTDKIEWTSARDLCRSDHTDLASVRDEEESNTIKGEIGGEKVWVGLFKDPWEWSDGSNSSLRYWEAGQKVNTNVEKVECVMLVSKESGQWAPKPCNDKQPFICDCEKSLRRFFKVRISSEDSDLDLNDPAVTEDILKHIKQKMSETNFTHMEWRKHPDGRVFIKEPERKERRGFKC